MPIPLYENCRFSIFASPTQSPTSQYFELCKHCAIWRKRSAISLRLSASHSPNPYCSTFPFSIFSSFSLPKPSSHLLPVLFPFSHRLAFSLCLLFPQFRHYSLLFPLYPYSSLASHISLFLVPYVFFFFPSSLLITIRWMKPWKNSWKYFLYSARYYMMRFSSSGIFGIHWTCKNSGIPEIMENSTNLKNSWNPSNSMNSCDLWNYWNSLN